MLTTTILLAIFALQPAQPLRLGYSGTQHPKRITKETEAARNDIFSAYVREDVGYRNTVTREPGWAALASKLATGELGMGVFHGYEFAWAQQKYPTLVPVALAFGPGRYPTVAIYVRTESKAHNVADLRGKRISVPDTEQQYVGFYLERLARTDPAVKGQVPKNYFFAVLEPDNVSDALDAVINGDIAAAVVDVTAFEALQRRQPNRAKQLRELQRPQELPPSVMVASPKLDKATRDKLLAGLLRAHQNERGQTLLTIFGLTRFAVVDADFETILRATAAAYPPEEQ